MIPANETAKSIIIIGGIIGLIGFIIIIYGFIENTESVLITGAVILGLSILFDLVGVGMSSEEESRPHGNYEGKPCPDCGTSMRYVKKYDDWYCETCHHYKDISNQQYEKSKQPPTKEEISLSEKNPKEKLEELREMKENEL